MLLATTEAERERIEGELHDRVQHRLAAVSMRLGMAAATGDESTRELARTARDSIQEALRELRAVVRGIAPQALTDYGLPAAVADLAADFPLDVEVDIRLDERLPTQVEHTPYLVVSEAMTRNSQIAGALVVSEAAVRKHVGNIFAKLPLADGDRRVNAVLTYLRGGT